MSDGEQMNDRSRRGGYVGGLLGCVVGGLLWAVIVPFVIGEPLWALIPGAAVVVALAVGLRGYRGDPRKDLPRLATIFGGIVVLDVALVWWWFPLLPEQFQAGSPTMMTVVLVLTGLFVVVRLLSARRERGA